MDLIFCRQRQCTQALSLVPVSSSTSSSGENTPQGRYVFSSASCVDNGDHHHADAESYLFRFDCQLMVLSKCLHPR